MTRKRQRLRKLKFLICMKELVLLSGLGDSLALMEGATEVSESDCQI